MKRGLIIVGKCIAVIAVLVFIRTVLGNYVLAAADHDAVNFAFACIAAMLCILVYRMNTNQK